MNDCHDILGYYLHHFPYLGLRGNEDKQKADAAFSATRQKFLNLTGLDPLDINAADCGGGCGSSCGGDSGGSSCGTEGGRSHGNDDGGGIFWPFNDSSNDRGSSKRPKQEKKPTPKPQKKSNIWHRILGLSQAVNDWERSVSPQRKGVARPGRAELLMLAKDEVSNMTRH